MKLTPVLGLSFAFALAACGDDGGGSSPDAAPDAPTGGIVGTWNRVPGADPNVPFDKLTFNADGTMFLDDGAPSDRGTYVYGNGRLFLDPDEAGEQSSETDVVLDGDQLALSAFMPQGTVTGFVGTWQNRTVVDGTNTATYTLTLAADQSATFAIASTSTSTITGTWTSDATGVVFNGTSPVTLTQYFQPLGTRSLSYLLFARAP